MSLLPTPASLSHLALPSSSILVLVLLSSVFSFETSASAYSTALLSFLNSDSLIAPTLTASLASSNFCFWSSNFFLVESKTSFNLVCLFFHKSIFEESYLSLWLIAFKSACCSFNSALTLPKDSLSSVASSPNLMFKPFIVSAIRLTSYSKKLSMSDCVASLDELSLLPIDSINKSTSSK